LAGATPNGLVDLDTYQALKGELLEGMRTALPVDGVYLSLHGAMEVEGLGDGETDLARAVRQLVGPDIPISVSLDLHGNLSPEFIASANVFTALRTAPHVDGPETRTRAIERLIRCIRTDKRPITAMVKLPMLLPGENAVTAIEPSKSLYEHIEALEQEPGVWDASLMIACAWTDSPYTSVSTLVVADDLETAKKHARSYADMVWERRHEFGPEVDTIPVDDAILRAISTKVGPVFISDSGDNPTAGGAGDLPVFLARLLALEAKDVFVGGLTDAPAVQKCTQAGLGAIVSLSLGGKLDVTNSAPFNVEAEVIHLAPGFATVQIDGVTVLLVEGRRPFHTLDSFAPAGVDPLSFHIVVVKQGYLAPDLKQHASDTIMALTPGFTDLRLDHLPYRHLPRPIFPLDDI
jgi:microcystin degradation protein MlrC